MNDLDSPAFLHDVQAVASDSLTGIVLPKARAGSDIVVADRVLSWMEAERRLRPSSLLIMPILETSQAIKNTYEIATASARIAYLGGLGVKGADVEREVGYQWTRKGDETFTIRSWTLLEARAAGVQNPMTGLWTDVDDVEGLRAFARQSRQIGYEGMTIIHPSHASIANDAFTLSERELDRYRRLIEVLEAAEKEGRATGDVRWGNDRYCDAENRSKNAGKRWR